ncbi:MAG: matrixin family metalloprotease [Verrucomicrobiota bacterium]
MNGSIDRLLQSALALAALGGAAAAFAYSFIINDSQPQPNGTGLPVKWPAGTIPLRLMLGDTANLQDGASFNQSASTAAQTWNAVLGSAQLTTTFVSGSPGSGNGLNELAFASTIFGRDFEENTLAVTTGRQSGNERAEADVIFNTRHTWNSYRGNRQAGVVDIQRVALHELGHVLGLDHPNENSQQVDAIMNSRITDRFELSPDDIEGAQSLYGPPGVPANDNFASATVLTLNSDGTLSVKGHNTNATKEANEPSHANDEGNAQNANPGGRSVWWRWTAPSSASITMDTRGSYFDTLLGIHTGNSVGNLTRVTGDDDITAGVVQASSVTFNTVAGTTYHIAVDGFNNNDGNGADNGGITLNLSFSGNVNSPPAITIQPGSVTRSVGQIAAFSVTATGATPLNYQWHFNNAPISGATSNTHSISSVTTAHAGAYHVVVSNSAGSVTSDTATLTVTTPPPSSGGGGGGGGGAPSLWFLALLAALGLARKLRLGN